jgi:hypothetical protein
LRGRDVTRACDILTVEKSLDYSRRCGISSDEFVAFKGA